MPDATCPAFPFDAQFQSTEEYDEVIEDIKRSYLLSLAYGDEPDPAESTANYLLETYHGWDVEPTRDDVARLVAPHMEEIERDLPVKRREVEREMLADQFFDLRRKGRTVASIARSLGEEPNVLAHTAANAQFVTAKRSGVDLAHAIRLEEVRAKAYRARTRFLSKLTKKLETALETRDFSDVSSDKLADLMLRMAELTKDETPPRPVLSVRNQRI